MSTYIFPAFDAPFTEQIESILRPYAGIWSGKFADDDGPAHRGVVLTDPRGLQIVTTQATAWAIPECCAGSWTPPTYATVEIPAKPLLPGLCAVPEPSLVVAVMLGCVGIWAKRIWRTK